MPEKEQVKRSAESEEPTDEQIDAKRPKLDDSVEGPKEGTKEQADKKDEQTTNGKAHDDSKLKGKMSKKYADVPEDEDEDEDNEGEEDDEEDANPNADIDVEDDDVEEDSLEEIDTSNILHGRRTRGKVIDYEKTAAKIGQSTNDDDEDDEDADADFKEPA